jgi:cytochrome c-type biogenesis protein CcmH
VLRQDNPAAPAVAAADGSNSTLAALEKAVLDNPKQPEAWSALAAAHFDDGNFKGAVEAYQKATELSPNSGGLWSALGEALVMASEGDPMPPAALAAFEKAITINAKDPRARYFMAVKKDLTGDHQGAINDWFALLADTPSGAPWEADLRRTIEQVAAIHKIDVASRLAATQPRAPTAEEIPLAARAIPGPTRQDMEAASQLPKGQQDAMISGMVASLEGKIAANPKNVDQWIMLMRSRMSLGETQKASKALKDAIAANPEARARLTSQAELLGVPAA